MGALTKDELNREINALGVDGKTFIYKNKKQESEYSGTFTGVLTVPGHGPRNFKAQNVRINNGGRYQVVGDYHDPVSGIYEWIVINLYTDDTGPVKIITFDDAQGGEKGVVMGGLVGDFPLSYSQGTITIDNKSGDGFEVSDLNFTYGSGEKEYSFSNGKVSIKKN
ncbi:hypothetical protein [Pseudomonas alkylphenolica]|uniref:hypothetical protein n=1 Tax=Pseudomonas alkylphenolica TaxID=237609 RepID=UPI00056FF5E1|nr:hypothetical protein [Pseudomonas alkylphenolica]